MRKIVILMSILSTLFGCTKKSPTAYPQDSVTAADGSQITFTFYAHASLGIAWNGIQIYVDPVGEFDWQSQPKADLLLVTHSHYDHLELSTIEQLQTEKTVVLCDKTSAEAFEHDCVTMLPRAISMPVEGVTVRAVPAYNISEGHTDFHPKSREDCGYLNIKDVDIAFLPVNQPYTMTVEQAARVVKAIKPKIFYPYHYGQVDEKTDIEALKKAVEGVTEIRVFPME